MDLEAHAKSVIESLACAVHHQYPSVIISDHQVETKWCCPNFKIICLRELVKLLMADRKPLSVAWKKQNSE